MSETTTDTTPALTLRWKVEAQHSYRFDLPHWRDRFIEWFRLGPDASDADIVVAIEQARRIPSQLLMELDELSASSRTWNDSTVDDVDDFEVHNVPGVPR